MKLLLFFFWDAHCVRAPVVGGGRRSLITALVEVCRERGLPSSRVRANELLSELAGAGAAPRDARGKAEAWRCTWADDADMSVAVADATWGRRWRAFGGEVPPPDCLGANGDPHDVMANLLSLQRGYDAAGDCNLHWRDPIAGPPPPPPPGETLFSDADVVVRRDASTGRVGVATRLVAAAKDSIARGRGPRRKLA
mmetsp:Transcript_29953/g.89659  ORF Transcript_29953/g.89659 Transcript_29953/m.89659 type:complete len:196 (-) Transcript_29953:61-648(-)